MRDYFDILTKFASGALKSTEIFGGSQRRFFRVLHNEKSYIVLLDSDTAGLARYALLLQNLIHRGIWVPQVFAMDENSGTMIMEDIGSLSLYDWYRISGDIEPFFRSASALTKIHSLNDVPGQMETEFNAHDLLFETQYFLRHFLVGYCGFPQGIGEALDEEFRVIAHRASQSPKALMHRDYQSQNIFITHKQVRIVDFQSARRGFVAYDVASLIEDPYVDLPEAQKKRILEKYLEHSSLTAIEIRSLVDAYPYCALQRLMQATAAFAYLSLVQNRNWFERFIIPACARLRELTEYLNEFPILSHVLSQTGRLSRKNVALRKEFHIYY